MNKVATFKFHLWSPLGSSLGPSLFILHISDLADYLMDTRVSLHADDTALYFSNNLIKALILTLHIEFSTVGDHIGLTYTQGMSATKECLPQIYDGKIHQGQ